MMRGKYVLIGDFDEDLHGTYIGDVPGPMLSFISYKFLKDGKHIFSIPLFLLLLLIYTTILTCILCDVRIKFYCQLINWLYKKIALIKVRWLSLTIQFFC